MKKFTILLGSLFFGVLAFSQGNVNFDNFTLDGNNYYNSSFYDQFYYRWDFNQAKGGNDAQMNPGDNAIMLSGDYSKSPILQSQTIPGGIAKLSFDYMQVYKNNDVNLTVKVTAPDQYLDTSIVVTTSNETGSVKHATLDMSSLNITGDYRISFIQNPNGKQVSIDNITWTVPPCSVPTKLKYDNVTNTTADVSWHSDGGLGWVVIYGPKGFDPVADIGKPRVHADTITTADPNYFSAVAPQTDGYTITGLTHDSTYNVYVKNICTPGSFSDVTADSVEFTMTANCPAPIGVGVLNSYITNHSAYVYWNQGGSENKWEFACLSSGVPSSGDLINRQNTTLTGLTDNTNYTLYVRAVCATNLKSTWQTATFTTAQTSATCEIPSNVDTLDLTSTSIKVTWDNFTTPPANGVMIVAEAQNPGAPDFPLTVSRKIAAMGSGYMLVGLTPNTKYDLYVTSICNTSTTCSKTSDTITFTTPEAASPCLSVSNLTQVAATANSATITWTPAGDESKWTVVYRKGVYPSDPPSSMDNMVVVTDTFVTISNLEPNSAYGYYIVSRCANNQFVSSSNAIFSTNPETLLPTPPSCPQPTHVMVKNTSPNSITLLWDGGTATNWKIYYGPAAPTGFDPEAPYTTGGHVAYASTVPYTITGLDTNTTYRIYVQSICASPQPSWNSDPIVAKTEKAPINPTDSTDSTSNVNNQIFDSFKYYPNPVGSQLNLEANGNIGRVQVSNLLGETVKIIHPQTSSVQINTSELEQGLYLINVSINGVMKTYKFVKR